MIEDVLVSNCIAETHKHVKAVSANINQFVHELLDRAEKHDASKFEEPELSIFAVNTPKLSKTEYGCAEYIALLDETKVAVSHHHANNRHHPEFHKNGINDMTLVDLVEMLSDWKASTARVRNGNIRKSIEVNATRFEISPQLQRILENTVKETFKD